MTRNDELTVTKADDICFVSTMDDGTTVEIAHEPIRVCDYHRDAMCATPKSCKKRGSHTRCARRGCERRIE